MAAAGTVGNGATASDDGVDEADDGAANALCDGGGSAGTTA